MNVICQTTNAWIAGIHVPQGQCEINLSGQVMLYATAWGPSNIVVGTGDTLAVYDEGFTLIPGYGLLEAWVLGFSLAFVGFGTIGAARRLARFLSNPSSPENL